MHKFVSSILLASTLMLVSTPVYARSIIGISIPVNSQSHLSRPAADNVFSAVVSGGVLNINLGIGIIVNPTYPLPGENFALHQDQQVFSTPYIAAWRPDPATSTVTFTFDTPTVVSGVELVQHVFGVTQITGRLGNSLGSLQSLGSVFGPSGDVFGGGSVFVVPTDGVSQIFSFGNTSQAGTVFTFEVNKTVYYEAYGLFRAYPLDAQGNRIPAVVAIPKKFHSQVTSQ